MGQTVPWPFRGLTPKRALAVPLGESVPALSDVRVLVPGWFPWAPWLLTAWLFIHFGFTCSCPIGNEPSLHLKLLYYSALSCLPPSASTCFLLGICTSCFLFLAHTSFLSSSGSPWSFSILELPYHFLLEASVIIPDCSGCLSCVISGSLYFLQFSYVLLEL